MPESAQNYLHDVLPELINKALEARADASRKGQGMGDFDGGRALAYYEVVSYLVEQLEVFGIDRASVRVAPDFNPDRELL